MCNLFRDALRWELVCIIFLLGSILTSTANANDPNLVGWWRLNEGSGTLAIDSSGNNLNG